MNCFPEFVVVTDELLLEFDNWFAVAIGNYRDDFTEVQLEILYDIIKYIEKYPAEEMGVTIEQELQNSEFWKGLRIISKRALQEFSWNSEKPPLNRLTYVPGKQNPIT